jgi:hypothetical protein
MQYPKVISRIALFNAFLIISISTQITSCGGGGSGGGMSTNTSPPLIQALVLSFPVGSAPANLPNAIVSITDATTGADIANASVTVNGVALTYNGIPTHLEYEGTVSINPGESVVLVVNVGGRTYTASGNQSTSNPVISVPAVSGATWSANSPNTVVWSGGTPITNATYLLGVLDAADPAGGVAYFQTVDTNTNFFSIPANSMASGIHDLIVGITTVLSIANADTSSSLYIGGFNYIPVTVTSGSVPISWISMSAANEYAYYPQTNMTGDREYIELDVVPNTTYSIVLREYVGNTAIKAYSSSNLLPSDLIAYADSPGLENNVIELSPSSLNKVYLEIIGAKSNQYSVTIRVPSKFLEPGFPVDTVVTAGTYQGGAESRAVTIGNIDGDPDLEIIYSGTAQGPLYAFKHDGSTINGWPFLSVNGTAYPSIGELDGNNTHGEIATGYGPFLGSCENDQFLISGDGNIMDGWPKTSCNAGTTTPPMLADIDNDGIDEIFMSGGKGYYSNGNGIPAWSSSAGTLGQAFGDITGDGQPNIVMQNYYINAYYLDGTPVSGFPVTPTSSLNEISGGPLGLADLDGGGRKEIVQINKVQENPGYFIVRVYNGSGALLWQRETADATDYRTVPSFGDINGDGLPEILIQTNSKIYAWDASGSLLPNFPIDYTVTNPPGYTYNNAGSSAPLVADVTGDQVPDIIIESSYYLLVYSATGQLEQKIRIFDNHIAPAVADIDLDGRNEIIVAEDIWNGINYEKRATIWVYDLGGANHGAVQWGQVGGSARHQFSYPAP